MIRILFWFVVLAAATFAATWLADRPGTINIEWLGYQVVDLSIGLALIAIAAVFIVIWILWGLLKWVLGRPSALGGFFARRRERKGREALTQGLIAIGAGDEKSALQHAQLASRKLPGDPLAKLLEAQTALRQGDTARVTQVYKEMVETPETKLLGLRGLFDQARQTNDIEAARGFAEKALSENAGARWASNAMLTAYSSDGDWPAVLSTLENQFKADLIDKDSLQHKKAVVLTAHAMSVEDRDIDEASDLATRAHKLDPSLVPAAVVAARTLSVAGSLRKASKILEQTWKLSPHPDVAEIYVHIRPGDSPSDRLKRAQDLLRMHHGGEEGAVALATAAIAASDWTTAREALNASIHDRPRARICMLMAEIETGEFADKGRAREWLARAVRAPRDPAWTADGFVSSEWLPISPITGNLGVFEWKIPVEGLGYTEPGKDEDIISVLSEPDVVDIVEDETPVEAIEVVDVTPVEEPQPEEKDDEVTGAKQEDDKDTSEEKKPDDVEAGDDKTEADEKQGSTEKETDGGGKKKSPNPASKTETENTDEKDIEVSSIPRQPDDPGPEKTNGSKAESGWFK